MKLPSLSSLPRISLALAFAAMLCGGTATASGSAPATLPTVARATVLAHGDAVLGALPMAQPIHIEVALKMRDRAGLDTLLANNADNQAHGRAPRLMTPAEFLAGHAPTQEQALSVVEYLTRMGYTHITVAPNRLLVSADGTAATAAQAFMTSFVQVRTHDGRIAFANADDVRIPASLQDRVLAVVGLQSVYLPQTDTRQSPKKIGRAQAANGSYVNNPLYFSSIYGGAGVPTAAGVNVGIMVAGDLTQPLADLSTFATMNNLPAVATQVVHTNGSGTDTSDTLEWDLDSQDVVGMGGGQVGKIIFYAMPEGTNANMLADFNRFVTDNQAKIITDSYYECELVTNYDGSRIAGDQIFAVAAAQGQTISTISGDIGADVCAAFSVPLAASWPASSPYVVAVGGTILNITPDNAWTSEVVWNDLPCCATGGAPSLFEPMPAWQKATVPGNTRGTVDVSFDADPGVAFVLDGAISPGYVGGTSLSSPLFAGLWARVLGQYPTIGFAAPIIYALPAADFHDVTSGNDGGENAAVGYDFPTGRGSMILSKVIVDAPSLGNKPPIARFTAATDGQTVVLTDTSSDSDGTIASHAWNFGDGKTSTGANPIHHYAASGVYSVSETVKDRVGASATMTVQVAAGGTQLLENSGFENATVAPWTFLPASVLTSDASLAFAGNRLAQFGGGAGASTDQAFQLVTIPSGKTSATLSFRLHTTTAETSKTVGSDHLYVRVRTASGTLLSQLASYSNLDASSGYVLYNLDMSAYIGQQVQVLFLGINGANLPTTWDLDDVKLWVQ